ncbi:MAG TPA: metal ABC transporter substrate-binding protein [Thermodesulfobacteriota bacterium]|nr:metal ABC transporter substrate-binding protein [Thermodesulfobacteriota bacterium]
MKLYNKIRRFTILIAFAVVSVFFLTRDAAAKVQIVASLPDFGAIAEEIGGDKVNVVSLAKGYQDPHFVDAKPTYVTKLNRADLLIYNGLDLEIGWLPPLITGSRNSKIASTDAQGRLDASAAIPQILEVPTAKIDRSMGDIHPMGNPHYLLDPRNGVPVAAAITERLKEIDPENSSYYEENYNNFVSRLNSKIKEWDRELAPYKGTEIVSYHKNLEYFSEWAGFKEVGFIEPKPGIPPSPSHVAELINQMKATDVKLVIASNYYPQKTGALIAEKTGTVFLSIPTSVGGEDGIKTYTNLFDTIVGDITSALKTETGKNENSASKTGQ